MAETGLQAIDKAEVADLLEKYEERQGLSDDLSSTFLFRAQAVYDLAEMNANQLVQLHCTLTEDRAYDGCAAVVLIVGAQ